MIPDDVAREFAQRAVSAAWRHLKVGGGSLPGIFFCAVPALPGEREPMVSLELPPSSNRREVEDNLRLAARFCRTVGAELVMYVDEAWGITRNRGNYDPRESPSEAPDNRDMVVACLETSSGLRYFAGRDLRTGKPESGEPAGRGFPGLAIDDWLAPGAAARGTDDDILKVTLEAKAAGFKIEPDGVQYGGRPRKVLGDSVEMPSSGCTECGEVLDAAAIVGQAGKQPSPGDLSLCAKCGSLNTFGDDLRLRAPTTEEVLIAARDPRIQALRRAIKAARRPDDG